MVSCFAEEMLAVHLKFWSDVVGTDFNFPGDGYPAPLGGDEVDASVAEGLRLVAAFTKIKHQSDRRVVIDLAEWLGK